jgi:predicted transcriptional regulator of viral defense system
MQILQINKIKKLYFDHTEIARMLGITSDSARVSASRYVRQGVLLRAKRDMYILKERWKYYDRQDRFIIANLLQVPSYVSLMSALDYYQITTQMQQDFIESIVLKRTKVSNVEDVTFNFTRIKNNLYFGYEKLGEFFIATPEKAFLDAIYLMSLGRYRLDLSSIDGEKLNMDELKKKVNKFPIGTKRFLEENGYF